MTVAVMTPAGSRVQVTSSQKPCADKTPSVLRTDSTLTSQFHTVYTFTCAQATHLVPPG